MESNHEPKSKLEENILKRIRTNDLTMRPKAYFVIKLIALVAVSALVLSVIIATVCFPLYDGMRNIFPKQEITLLLPHMQER